LQATVGVDSNIISASMCALLDGFEYALVEYAPSCSLDRPRKQLQQLQSETDEKITAEINGSAAPNSPVASERYNRLLELVHEPKK
jgi:hypothetical protein